VAGAVITAAIYGDDVGKAAIYASIGAVVGFGIGYVYSQFPIPASITNSWTGDLIGLGVAAGAGALGGGLAAEAMGRDFSEGAITGAIGGAIGWAITEDLPDSIRNYGSENRRFHLAFGLLGDAWDGLGMLVSGKAGAWSGFGEGAKIGLAGEMDAFSFGTVKGAFGTDTSSREYGFARGAGVVARDSLLTAAGVGGAKALGARKWAMNSKYLGKASTVFGKSTGVLNKNNYLRVGWGANKGVPVFRIGIGGFKPGLGQWIRNTVGQNLSHIDF